jgi:hypothetical protein
MLVLQILVSIINIFLLMSSNTIRPIVAQDPDQ